MADTKLDVIVKVKDEFTSDMKKIGGNVDSVRDKFKTAGAAITGVGVAGGLMIKSVAGASATMESMGVAMKTAFQGDAGAAKAAMDRIKEFANETPYGLQEVTGAFLKLKNLGLDPSEEALTSYGNTASSMGKSLNDMIEAVADASTGEFERLKEFGIRTKVEGDKVKFTFQGITTEVGNNAEEIEGYLQGIGNTQFAGGMEAQSQTLGGQISTLKDSFFNLQAAIGDTMAGPLKTITGLFTEFAASISAFLVNNPMIAQIAGTVMLLVTGLALLGGPIILLLGFLPAMAAGFAMVSAALAPVLAGLLAFAAPIAAIIAALGLLYLAWTTNFGGIQEKTAEVVRVVSEWFNEMKTKVVTAVTDIYNDIKARFDDIKNAITERLDVIKEEWAQLFDGMKDEESSSMGELNANTKTNLDLILSTISGTLTVLTTAVSVSWNLIKGSISVVLDFITGIVKSSWALISGVITTGLNLLQGDWEGAWESIKGIFTGVWDSMKGAVTAAWEHIKGVIDKIVNGVTTAINKLKSLATFGIGGGGGAGKATGGYVRAGVTYPVGERGPEMFTPQKSGYITPNHKMGGGGVTINITGTFLSEDAAEAMGDMMLRNLKLNNQAV